LFTSSPLSYFNCASEYSIRKAQEKQERLELNGSSKLLVFPRYVKLRGKNISHNKKKLLQAIKKIGLEMNAEKTERIFTCRYQNAQQTHNINLGNKSFKYFQNSITREQQYHQN
jgi:hypothetical protein